MKRYCGRRFTGEEIGQLCALIADNPGRTRAQLSRLACRLLQWRKADGGLKEMSCRVAMLRMHREGLLQLPPLATAKEARAESSTLSGAPHSRRCPDRCMSCPACIWSRS